MASLGQRVKKARELRGWTQADLAQMIGGNVKQQNVQQLEADVVTSPRYLAKLIEVLQVRADWLIHGLGPMWSVLEEGDFRKPLNLPMYDLISLCNWPEIPPPVDSYTVDGSWSKSLSDLAFIVRLQDNAMKPAFPAGSMVLIDPGSRSLPDSTVLAVSDGRVLLRDLGITSLREDRETYSLSPRNRRFPELHSEHSRIVIIGVLKGAILLPLNG